MGGVFRKAPWRENVKHPPGKRQLLALWKKQKGLCPRCHQRITKLTGWHNHHKIWRSKGGGDQLENRVLYTQRATNNSIAKGRPKWNRVLKRAFERLELLDAEVSRAVLRGGDDGNIVSLPDRQRRAAMNLAGCPSYIFGTLKDECVGEILYSSHDEAISEIFIYIEAYYNRVRRHSPRGYVSLLQYEKIG